MNTSDKQVQNKLEYPMISWWNKNEPVVNAPIAVFTASLFYPCRYKNMQMVVGKDDCLCMLVVGNFILMEFLDSGSPLLVDHNISNFLVVCTNV
jgi:hypothetical protein